MNILVIADQKSKALWDYFEPGRLDDIDLVLSCGDLPSEYLSLLATFTKAPVLYVHGNHDESYTVLPPEGCVCIDDMVYNFQGIRIMGLGGSIRYKKGTFQYTEKEMAKRYRKMWFKLRRAKGVDIFLTHSPAFHMGDEEDPPHVGFKVFKTIIDTYHPKYMIHGHVHLNYGIQKRVRQYEDTTLINGYEEYRFVYETGERL